MNTQLDDVFIDTKRKTINGGIIHYTFSLLLEIMLKISLALERHKHEIHLEVPKFVSEKFSIKKGSKEISLYPMPN